MINFGKTSRRASASLLERTKAVAVAAAAVAMATTAHAAYWNTFNVEGESTENAAIVSYATLDDMLNDTNRTGVFEPSMPAFDANIVDSGSDGRTYWNLFNVEGESTENVAFVTYATRDDMLMDTNRTGVFEPSMPAFDANIVGSGSDGKTYWNLFNVEGEYTENVAFVTYASLDDMLNDTNRTGVFEPSMPAFDANIVGTGSDGTTYWNLFNVEGESSENVAFVTYASLADMLGDTNRTGVFEPSMPLFDANIVGGGSDEEGLVVAVPEPATWLMMIAGLAALGSRQRLRRSARALAT